MQFVRKLCNLDEMCCHNLQSSQTQPAITIKQNVTSIKYFRPSSISVGLYKLEQTVLDSFAQSVGVSTKLMPF